MITSRSDSALRYMDWPLRGGSQHMVIITADDYGGDKNATDSILACFSGNRITSTSAMVFMEDSERAASLAVKTDLEVGLHLNFTQAFSAYHVPAKLREYQSRIMSYLTKNRLSQVIYNPLLADAFQYAFLSQREEFERLYRRPPDHYNGHHHMHLCANLLAGRMIPNNARIRTTYTFDQGEKNLFNRLYRYFLGRYIAGKYISTDCFFSIAPIQNYERLQEIFKRSSKVTVEIEVHPEDSAEAGFLLSDRFQLLLGSARCGGFRQLQ
jgi:predicted glycoside hydrolase/deacetylase ChbG (UPF0249 family)